MISLKKYKDILEVNINNNNIEFTSAWKKALSDQVIKC